MYLYLYTNSISEQPIDKLCESRMDISAVIALFTGKYVVQGGEPYNLPGMLEVVDVVVMLVS